MKILEKLHWEWWQVLLLLLVLGMFPIFKAFATILVGRLVKPEIAKIALPLILAARAGLRGNKRNKQPADVDDVRG